MGASIIRDAINSKDAIIYQQSTPPTGGNAATTGDVRNSRKRQQQQETSETVGSVSNSKDFSSAGTLTTAKTQERALNTAKAGTPKNLQRYLSRQEKQ